MRLQIIKDGLDRDADSRQVAPEFGNVLEAIVRNWAAVLEDIPTRYLEEAFLLALRSKTNDFPLTAYSVNRAYDEMLPEIERQAELAATARGYAQLPAPKPNYVSREEFKVRHNLPRGWKPGDPYPKESDLYREGT